MRERQRVFGGVSPDSEDEGDEEAEGDEELCERMMDYFQGLDFLLEC